MFESLMGQKYKTILADPPWPERGGGRLKRGADRHYPLMTVAEIMAMPVVTLADDEGCHLYLWATNNYLAAGFDVLKAWGFRYITNITWKKDRFGIGQYYRGLTEHCLFGVRGRLPYKITDGKRQQGVTGFDAPRGRHSEKPEFQRQQIEKVSYAPRVELFARKTTTGWDVWGNEINDDAIADVQNIYISTITWDHAGRPQLSISKKNLKNGEKHE